MGAGRRFGPWSLDAHAGELRDGARRVRLQEKPLRLLLLLLERPGEVIPKEELYRRLWPDGTFVDYEHGLGNAVHKLREALGDSAAAPQFVETVRRRGLRFVAPVTEEAVRVRWRTAGRVAALLAGALFAAWVIWAAVLERRADRPRLSTGDALAREAYLRGEHFFDRKTPGDVQRSAECFRRAIAHDPGFVEAWVSLAYAHHFQGALSVLPPEEALERSSEAARAALGIDDDSARAHAILAETTFRFGGGGAAAEAGFRRALRLDPTSPQIHHWYGNYLAANGHRSRALAELERAFELDPLDLHVSVDLAMHLYNADRHAEAREHLRRTLELDPRYPKTHYLAGSIALKEGRPEEAMTAFRRAFELAPDVPKFLHALASAAVRAGQLGEARSLTAQLAALEDRYVPPELLHDLEARLHSAAAAEPVRR
jgi:DNA-binding winged helix-turn-helix (wHTH) protein/Tfp pilus assembly protein PilF